jgi:hypothetical protein
MNKPHAAPYRKPSSAPAIQAAIQHTIAWPSIAGSAQSLAIPRAALKWSSCLTSGPTLPPLGSNQRGPFYNAAATLMGTKDQTRHPKIVSRAQIPLQREADRRHPPRSSKGKTPVAAAGSAGPHPVVTGIGPTTSASGGTNEKTDGVQVLPVAGDGRVEPDHDGYKHPQIVPHAQIPLHPEAPPPKAASTLRNGNPRGNPNAAPRCGAKTRTGCPCRGPAMKNGRCRMHGGASTGPSAEGRARIAAARTTHGMRTAAMRAFGRPIVAIARRGTVMSAMVRAGLRVEDLAAPIRQCRTTSLTAPLAGPPLPRKASMALRDRCFVLRELTAMDFTRPELRSLLTALGAGPKTPPPREAAQIPLHREAAPKPPRKPLICHRPRQPQACRRDDPANPFPARANPHATWDKAETSAEPGVRPNPLFVIAEPVPAIPNDTVRGFS